MTGPCDDLRIIDLSSGAVGGIATMVLADFGADVIKVEPPGGDPARALPAAPMWLRGKRSVTLDLGRPGGREQLHALVTGADVVVSTYPPGEAAKAGADYETLAAINPALVYCSITAMGPKGPYAGYAADERVVSAKAGRMMAFAGIARRDGPSLPAVLTASHAASQSAISGILAAILVRDRTGRGQLVETSLLQGTFPYDLNSLLRAQMQRRYPERLEGDPYAALSVVSMPTLGYQPIMAKDGRWIQLANLLEHLFFSSIEALDLTTEVVANPRYAGAPRQLDEQAREEVRNLMLDRARERDADEWMRIFHENGNVAADYAGTAQQALHNPDLVANGEVMETRHPTLGTVRQLGLLARLTDTPGAVGATVPEPGEHTAAVLAEPPRTARRAAASNGAPPRHPLEGVTVLEFATIIAAPLGASLLADLGARVIKIEPANGGDPYRTMGAGFGAYFGSAKTTAGKESICIDLKSERGQAVVHRLAAQADVVVHNYRPGVPERLGIGYEQLRALRPELVYVSANGYGPDGPSAHRPAAHPIPGAVDGGALMQAGSAWPGDVSDLQRLREASRWFYRANEANPDPNTSVVVVSAALLGLHARRRTGRGQKVFLSMLGANAYANSDDFISYEGKAERPTLDAELRGLHALYRLYRASEGWVFLCVQDEAQWRAFCSAVGRDDLASRPDFADAAARRSHDEALGHALDELFATRDADAWEQLLVPAGIACVRADGDTPGSFFDRSEQMRANGFDLEAEHTIWGRYQRWGPTVTFSDTPGRYGPGVLAGQHTDAILAEVGYSAEEIAQLRADGVVSSEEPLVLSEPSPA